MVAVAVVLAAALVATLAFLLVQGSQQDASGSIDAVAAATSPTLAKYRTQVADAGGSITVTWSAPHASFAHAGQGAGKWTNDLDGSLISGDHHLP